VEQPSCSWKTAKSLPSSWAAHGGPRRASRAQRPVIGFHLREPERTRGSRQVQTRENPNTRVNIISLMRTSGRPRGRPCPLQGHQAFRSACRDVASRARARSVDPSALGRLARASRS
jgi:hypothetical protein